MSLVITSNTPKNNINTPTAGINLPYSYTNHLQGTLKIPPQSQIAVQSVKFNKTGNIQLNKFNTQFGFLQGRDISATIDGSRPIWDDDKDINETDITQFDVDNNSLMIPTYLLGKDDADKNFSYNTREIADELQVAWKKSIYHPNLLENASSAINPGPKVIALRNASEQGFQGFEFQLHNASAKPGGNPPPANVSTTWINADFGKADAGYAAGVRTVSNTDLLDYQSFIGTQFPLSLVNGSFNCSFGTHRSASNVYSEFAIGLTRACLPNSTDNDLPYYFNPYKDLGFSGAVPQDPHTYFYDWVVCSVETAPARHQIKLYHLVNEDDRFYRGDQSAVSMEEVDYGTRVFLEDTLSTSVFFNIQNERVTVDLLGGGGTVSLVDGTDEGGVDGTTDNKNAKPVCPTTRFLYPKLLMKPVKTMIITDFTGVDVKDHTYNNNNYQNLWAQAKAGGGPRLNTAVGGRGNNTIMKWCHYLDTNITSAYDKSAVNWKIMNRQIGLEDPDGRLPDNFRLCSAPNTRLIMSNTLNADKLLGFQGNTTTHAEITYSVAKPNILQWSSNQVPSLTSTESMFVRLKNMTFDSANFSNSALSKILYHIPTFDNSGNDVGALHLEPNEMVYLDLNNPAEVHVSTMEVDLVYNDETLATGVEGKTVVVFHIRPKR